MRVTISNDRKKLMCRVDYDNLERTRLSASTLATATTVTVENAQGLATGNFVLVGEPGNGDSEIRKISTVTGLSVALTAALTNAHTIRDRVYKLDYDQVKFYYGPELLNENRYADSTWADANYTAIGSAVDLRPDYLTTLTTTISTAQSYCCAFYNSTGAITGPKGDKTNGYENQLCSIADLRKYEDISSVGSKVIDKIDIATWDIIPQFQTQEQDYKDLVNRDILRAPCALLALHYIFAELSKSPDDSPAIKAERYLQSYKSKINEVGQYINKTELTTGYQGQTQCLR